MTTQPKTATSELEAAATALEQDPPNVTEARAAIERAVKLLQFARCGAVAQLDQL